MSICPRRLLVLCALLLVCGPARAQWAQVGTGIEYAQFNLADPNRVFVARMDRSNLNAFIESSIAQGTLVAGKETVRSQAARYDGAINYWNQTWGNRNQVVVAVNGDFYNVTTGLPTGGQMQGGWYCKRFAELAGSSGFAWRLNRDVFIGPCVKHTNSKQTVTYAANGAVQQFTAINPISRSSSQLVIYTPQHDATTGTDASGSEVLVEMDRPNLILPSPTYARGVIRQIRPNSGSTPIPFDHLVLSATGSNATTLLANATVGGEVRITQEITNYDTDCNTLLGGFDWTKNYASVGTNFTFLKNGVTQSTTNAGLIVRNPRTAVAYNNTYVFFIVIDGRSTISVGMTTNEMASFCTTYLATPWAANLDGGGSSTMVVNGVVKNVPSDGSERAVANGLMMCVLQPRQLSTALQAGSIVRTTGPASIRLGPGTNYASIATAGSGASGTVLPHSIGGVLAKGTSWWKCSFASNSGWVDEALLASGVPGDMDGDNDVDQLDFGLFQDCLSGSQVTQPLTSCAKARLDVDTDVDAEDMTIFIKCVSGANQPGTPNCATAP